MPLRPTLEFLLHDWLDIGQLSDRPHFAEHSRDTIDAVLDMAERLARDKFAPANRTCDTDEPRFDGERVYLPAGTVDAARAYAATGLLAAAQDEADGGMQLPYVVEMAANAFFHHGSVGIAAYGLLTAGNANLIMAHGTPTQRTVFAGNELAGRWFGTMCLSEPQAGSSLGDITTRAVPDGGDSDDDPLGPRYRLTGHKMWISGGEHEITENIVHLVLAKVPDANGTLPAGTRGISLFIVPRKLVDVDGNLTGERNDVVLAGLNHKLGWRGTVNTLLNFGEGRHRPRGAAGAIGYRIGNEGDGLACMFHMMNEARINVGLGAAMLGQAGLDASLDYARQRLQGRPPSATGKAGAGAPAPIIEHADVKRMLLAQKAYAEGALALVLYCARLVDELHTGTPAEADEARLLLDLLTPIAKSWPSEWCVEANSLAIQIHGGYGYTRDFPVEQHWRDNRLNMIHEGTHGIQALDLLGRKVTQRDGEALDCLAGQVRATVAGSQGDEALAPFAAALESALGRLLAATRSAWANGRADEALGNATPYLQAFGHVVVAWLWLDVVRAERGGDPAGTNPARGGRLAALQYFFGYELPKIDAWLAPVAARNPLFRDLSADLF